MVVRKGLLSVIVVVVVACVIAQIAVVECVSATSVFDESLSTSFQDWSWGATAVNKQYNTTVRTGKTSVSFSSNSWNALYFHATDYIDSSVFSGIEFWLYRPDASSTNINFNMIVDGSSGAVKTGSTLTLLSIAGGAWPTNTWVKGSVAFSSFPVGVYDGFWFQDGSGATTNPLIVLDDVVLINAATTSTTTTTTNTPTTTTTATPTTTTTTAATNTSTTRSPTTTSTPTTTSPTTTKSPTTTTTRASNTSTTSTKPPSTTTTKAPNTTTRAPTTTTTAAPTTTSSPTTTTTTSPTTTAAPNGDVDADVLALYNTVTPGQATYYGLYTSGGECGLDPTPDSGKNYPVAHTVAIANYMLSRTCGMCLQVTGYGIGLGDKASAVNGTRVVFVNNECPKCPIGNLDFGLNGDGLWDISWKAVPCPVTSKIQYKFKEGSSPWWMGIQISNTVYPVYKVAVKVNGAWVYMPRFSYNYFIASFSGLQLPITLQMTSIKGEVIEDQLNSALNSTALFSGKVQFSV